MSIWSRIASVTFSASANDSTAKPRLVELSEKRYGKSVDPSLTAMVMTLMPLPLAMFAAAVACVRQFGAANVAQLVDGVTLGESSRANCEVAWPENGFQRSPRRLRLGGVDWTVMTPMTRSAKRNYFF